MAKLTMAQSRKYSATIWGVGWRMAAILFGAAFVIMMLNACEAGRLADVTVPNTTSQPSPIVFPLCTYSTVGVGETEMAVLDAIGHVPAELMPTGILTGAPSESDLDKSVQTAAKVYLAASQPITAGTDIKVCVDEKGFVASVNDMPVPTP